MTIFLSASGVVSRSSGMNGFLSMSLFLASVSISMLWLGLCMLFITFTWCPIISGGWNMSVEVGESESGEWVDLVGVSLTELCDDGVVGCQW